MLTFEWAAGVPMRPIIRGISWLIKAALLAAALAALALWPQSYNHGRSIGLSRWTPGPEQVEQVGFVVAWGNGRIAWFQSREKFAGEWLSSGHDLAAMEAHGWQWRAESGTSWFVTDDSHRASGPFRWNSAASGDRGRSYTEYYASIPFWLLAACAAPWPTASVALLIRRRARRRRLLARVGCCHHCGYDLRATPQAGHGQLARCPECGRDADPPETAAAGKG